MKTENQGPLSPQTRDDNKSGDAQTEQDGTLIKKNHPLSTDQATVPPPQDTAESVTVKQTRITGQASLESDLNIAGRAAEPAVANEPRYRLGQSDDGSFFWQDKDSGEQGTLETTDKREAERRLNLHNERYRDRILRRKFEVGDVVELMSGGPPMTIDAVSATGNVVTCVWMRGNKLQQHRFSIKALRIPQPEKRVHRAARKRRRKNSRK
jgi:uncharacterized protein YodC (DUF2158 family)